MIDIGVLAGRIVLDDQFSSRLDVVGRRLDEFSGKADKIGRSMQSFGTAMLPMSAAATALGAGVIKLGIDFESSFAGVRKTADMTGLSFEEAEAKFAQLEQTFRDMSKIIPVNVNEINRIAEAGGQLGVATDDLEAFTRTMADLSVATNLTSTAASEGLAQFANIIDNELGPQFDRLGSTIVELGNKSAATESQILEFGLRLAGAGKIAGLTEAEILGLGTALASVGINAEAGGTAFSKVMIEIASAVEGGGDALKDFAEVALGSADKAAEFAFKFREAPAEAMTLFVEGLGKVQKAGGDLFGVLEKLGVTETRMRDALLRSANAGVLLRESLDNGRRAWEENVALTQEAEKRYATLASQLTIVWNRIKDFGITIANSLMPTIRSMIQGIEPLLGWAESAAKAFANLPGPIRAIALALGGIIAITGPVAFGLGLTVRAVEQAGIGLAALIKWFRGSTAEALKNAGALTSAAIATDRLTAATTRAATQRAATVVSSVVPITAGPVFSRLAADAAASVPLMRGANGQFLSRAETLRRQALMPQQVAHPFVSMTADQLRVLNQFANPSGPMAAAASTTRSVGTEAAAAATQVGIFGRALTLLTNPVTTIGLGLTGLALAGRGLTGSWEYLKTPTREIHGGFQGIADIGESVGDIFKSFTDWARQGGSALKVLAPEMFAVAKGFNELRGATDKAADSHKNWLKSIVSTTEIGRMQRDIQGARYDLEGVAALAAKASGRLDKIPEQMYEAIVPPGFVGPRPPVGPAVFNPAGIVPGPAPIPKNQWQLIDEQLRGEVGAEADAKKAFQDALDDLVDGRKKVIMEAQVWAIHTANLAKSVGGHLLKLPKAVQEDLFDALGRVITQFGSLKKAGLESLQGTYEALIQNVGAAKEFFEEIRKVHAEGAKSFMDWAKEGAFKRAEQMGKDFIQVREEQREWAINWEKVSMSAYDFQLRQNQRWIDAERKKYYEMFGFSYQYLQNVTRAQKEFELRNSEALREKEKTESKTEYEATLDEYGRITHPGGRPMQATRDEAALKAKQAAEAAGFAFSSKFADTVIDTFTGGGNLGLAIGGMVGRSIGDMAGKQLSEAIGGRMGGFVGGLLPGIGALLGPLLGGLTDKITRWGKRMWGNVAKEAREEFASSLGFDDLASLYEDLQKQGPGGEGLAFIGARLIGRNDEAGNKAWMEDVKAYYDDIERRMSRVNELLGEATGLLERYGGIAPPSLQPLIQELLLSNKLTDEMRKSLEGMTGATDWKAMKTIAEEYGIALEGLGKHFQQAKLDEIAVTIATDFQFLEENGADVGAVLKGMSDEVQDLVDDARKFGLEIPENMRPVLQAMVDAGLLIDDAGEKLVDLSEFNFKAELETPFDRIVTVLEEIRDLLKNDLPAAFGTAAGAAQDYGDTVHNLPRVPGAGYNPYLPPDDPNTSDDNPTYDPNNPNDPYGGRDPSIPAALGGYFPARPGGYLVNLAEANEGEWVIPDRVINRLLSTDFIQKVSTSATDKLYSVESRRSRLFESLGSSRSIGSIGRMAVGGFVPARPGGTLRILGEANEGEWVIPESVIRDVAIKTDRQSGIGGGRISSHTDITKIASYAAIALNAYGGAIGGRVSTLLDATRPASDYSDRIVQGPSLGGRISTETRESSYLFSLLSGTLPARQFHTALTPQALPELAPSLDESSIVQNVLNTASTATSDDRLSSFVEMLSPTFATDIDVAEPTMTWPWREGVTARRLHDETYSQQEAPPSNPGYPWGTYPDFVNFGSSGYDTTLHNDELIMNPGDVPDLATRLAAALKPAAGGRAAAPQTVVVQIAGRTVAQVILPDTLTALENNDGGGAAVGPRERMKRIVGVS